MTDYVEIKARDLRPGDLIPGARRSLNDPRITPDRRVWRVLRDLPGNRKGEYIGILYERRGGFDDRAARPIIRADGTIRIRPRREEST